MTDPTVEALLDRAAIHDVIMRYAQGLDRQDFDLVASCFAPEATGEFGGASKRIAPRSWPTSVPIIATGLAHT